MWKLTKDEEFSANAVGVCIILTIIIGIITIIDFMIHPEHYNKSASTNTQIEQIYDSNR